LPLPDFSLRGSSCKEPIEASAVEVSEKLEDKLML